MTSCATLPHLDEAAVYLDGAFRPAAGRTDVREKATGKPLGSAGLGGSADLAAATAAARAAQAEWAAAPYDVRARLLRAAADWLERHADALADLIVRETGSIRGKADYEVGGAVAELHAAAGLAAAPVGEVLASQDPDRFSIAERIPVGVVAALTPWNFPLILAARVLAPALALGNVVLLKPSPETPLSGGLAIAAAFDAVGAPAGIFQAVCGDQEFSEALVAADGVDMVHFTGSTAVGRRIAATAGGLLRKVSLELGGNNAIVVLDDADTERAAVLGAWSGLHYQGQTCISAGRHLVHRSLLDSYAASLAARAGRIVVGDPAEPGTGLGPLINERQAARAEDLLRRSVAAGARVLAGGTRDGLFFRPTVVAGVAPGMPLWDEEVFAPIVPLTAFDTDAEALRLVNATGYGLVNSVVTADESRGRAFARGVRSGMVHINDATCLDEATAPFGGLGASGLGGRSGGTANLAEFTAQKWTTLRTTPPHYPY